MAENTTDTATVPEAPTPTPAPAPATTPPTEATPAQAPTAPAAPPTEQTVGMNDTIEYTDSSGNKVETTVQELTDAKEKVEKLGDLEGVQDMVGFFRGEPEAQKRVLQAQMDQIAPAPVADPQAEYVKQIEEKLAVLEGRFKPMERLVTQAEATEDKTYVGALLQVEQVKQQFPILSAKPDVSLQFLQPQYTKLRQFAASKGVDLSTRNDLVIQLLQRAESEMKNLFQAYGFAVPQTAAPVAPQANGQPAAQVPPIVPQIPGMMPQVPQTGGVMGAPSMAGNQVQQPGTAGLSRVDMLAKLKANRVAQGQQ